MNNQFPQQQYQQNFQQQMPQMMQNQFQNQFPQQTFQPQFQMPYGQQQQQQFMPFMMPQGQQFPQQFQQPFQQQMPMQYQQFPQMPFMMNQMMPQFPNMNPFGQQQQQQYRQMPQWQMMEKAQLDMIPPIVGKETNKDYPFKTEFQRVEDYTDETQLEETFPHLLNINQTTFNIPQKAVYFIIRSANEDDVHKAVKYNIWTSTSKSNQVLSAAWRENEKAGIPIYLFFVVFNQKQFYGVAKMTSDVQADKSFKYWAEGARFFGLLNIEWVFVKTIHESKFQEITDNETPVFQLKDCSQLTDSAVGEDLFSVFMDELNEPNLIEQFVFYDRREDILVACRDNDEFESRFNTFAQSYSLKNSSTKRIQNEEKEVIQQYSAKDQTVTFHDGKELNDVFVVKSKKQSQKLKKKGGKKVEDDKKQSKEPQASTQKQEALQEFENEKAQAILYESDDEEPQIEKIENKMDYSDDDKEGEDEEKAK